MALELHHLADDDFCYLTTLGRMTGRSHTIEIWFAVQGQTVYLLSGGREQADWVKNVQRQAEVQLRIRDHTFAGRARLITDRQEDALARKLLYEKYTPRDSDDLGEWSRASLPVAVDVALSDQTPT